VTTLWLGPLVSSVTATIFSQQTTFEVPEHQRRSDWGEHSISIVTLGATVAVAGYLNNLGSGAGNEAEMLSNNAILVITSCAGAITASLQSLSNKVTIIALWRNRHDYQQTPLYKQSVENAQPLVSARQISNGLKRKKNPKTKQGQQRQRGRKGRRR